MAPIRIALAGVGKIVRDQHAPVLEAHADFELVAAASPHSRLEGVPAYPSLEALLAAHPEVEAIGVTSTTAARHALALEAIRAGKHVLLEKPPCATLSALDDLRAAHAGSGRVLFAAWHTRFAPQVAAARAWLAAHPAERIDIVWREDVRRWHPGQGWIWEPGGLGVFDPGVNALATLTEIAPFDIHLVGAELAVPENRQAPISARLALCGPHGQPIAADFDWTGAGEQAWDIRAETAGGTLRLHEGGAMLEIDGRPAPQPAIADPEHAEYVGVYDRFAELVRTGASEIDERPLRLTADAFLAARRRVAPPFVE